MEIFDLSQVPENADIGTFTGINLRALIDHYLRGQTIPKSGFAYVSDVEAWVKWQGSPSLCEALRELIGLGEQDE